MVPRVPVLERLLSFASLIYEGRGDPDTEEGGDTYYKVGIGAACVVHSSLFVPSFPSLTVRKSGSGESLGTRLSPEEVGLFTMTTSK